MLCPVKLKKKTADRLNCNMYLSSTQIPALDSCPDQATVFAAAAMALSTDVHMYRFRSAPWMHASLHLIGQYQATIRIQREKKADQSPINRASLKTVLYHWFGYCFKLGSIQHYKGDYWKSANTTRSNLHAALKADPDDTDTTTTCARGTSS